MIRAKLHKTIVYGIRFGLFLALFESFYSLNRLLDKSALDSVIIFGLTLLIITIFDQKIIHLIHNVILKIFSPEVLKAINALVVYNQKLNTLVERKAIQEHFLYFFQKHVNQISWCIFWMNEDFFELAGINKCPKFVPEILEIPDKRSFVRYVATKKFWKMEELYHYDKSLDAFLSQFSGLHQECLLIPVNSSLNFNGLLLISPEFEHFLLFDQFNEIFFRIIRKTADVLEKADLYHDTYLQKIQSENLLEISKIISSTLNLDEVLTRIMDAIRSTISYDAGAIFLVNREKNILEYKYSVGYDPQTIKKIRLKINQGIVGKVIETGKPSIISDVSRSFEYFPLRKSTKSQLTLPIFVGEKTIGAIALESDQINHFRHSDVYFLQGLASHAAIAISNAWLYQDVLKKRELENDLLNAANVQRSLLVRRVPTMNDLDISITTIPSKIVGGDFYDIQKINETMSFVSIGDVAGKGASGAILMAVCLAGLRTFTKEIYSICEITSKLNNLLYETTTPNRYATFFMCKIDVNENKITFTNAGHNPPVLLKKSGEMVELKEGGIVIGFRNSVVYSQQTVPFEKGDILLLYTDGIVESKNHQKEEFGLERLKKIIQKHKEEKSAEIKNKILAELKEFTDTNEYDDDLTLIVIKHK
jgi:serine phosphatase RsbU (regulator of sigma subunit)/putative methionine-R-sulfoxide reductase with GAF domain